MRETQHKSWIDWTLSGVLFPFYITMQRSTLHAQNDRTITVRMLDSKTGQPITTS